MKNDEKACPHCAESIKLDALLCKHCSSRFTADEVAKHRANNVEEVKRVKERWLNRKIDEALLEELGEDDADELDGCEIRPHQIDEIAEDSGISANAILSRALFHKMELVDRARPARRNEWSDELKATIDADIRAHVLDGVISTSDRLAISKRHNAYGVEDRILELDLSYLNHKEELVDRKSARAKKDRIRRELDQRIATEDSPGNQYGSLQGLANLTGGCATGWGILFLILTLVLIVFAFKELLAEIF